MGSRLEGPGRSRRSVEYSRLEEMVCPNSYPTGLSIHSSRHRLYTILLAAACVTVTCCSSMAGSTYTGMKEDFHVGEEVCILSISLFVAGLGVGPRKST